MTNLVECPACKRLRHPSMLHQCKFVMDRWTAAFAAAPERAKFLLTLSGPEEKRCAECVQRWL